MNFALPTVAIIFAIIPGIIFRNSYFGGKFPKQIYGSSPVSEFAQYLLFAIPLNAAALYTLQHLPHSLKPEIYLYIFAGEFSEASLKGLAVSLKQNWLLLLISYLILIITASLIGFLLRRLVWTFRLDLRSTLFRMKHDWYYTLQGRIPGVPRQLLPIADILVQHPGEGSRLYRGVVSGFNVSNDGGLKELFLTSANRGSGRGKEFKWVEIPGDEFIIFGGTINSINMSYFSIDPPENRTNRLFWQLNIYLRSFFWEEP